MAKTDDLLKRLEAPEQTAVFYFASTEENLLREKAKQVRIALLQSGGHESPTVIEGPSPDIGDIIEAAGTLSFFGGRRIVELKEIVPSSMGDKDVEELCKLFSQLENSVLIVTVLYKDKKTATTKKAKSLLAAAKEVGYAEEIRKSTPKQNLEYLHAQAAELKVSFAPGAAQALIDRAGEDHVLLRSETEKLAALCGYQQISENLVRKYSVSNIEADVFELTKYITANSKAQAFTKLQELLELKQEPIAIVAALSGTYIDMYRAKAGAEKGKSATVIFEEMGYKGNSYRMQKAKENAAKYSMQQMEDCVLCLAELDAALKSSPLPDKSILLQTAMAELFALAKK